MHLKMKYANRWIGFPGRLAMTSIACSTHSSQIALSGDVKITRTSWRDFPQNLQVTSTSRAVF